MSAFEYDDRKFIFCASLANDDFDDENETNLLDENIGTIQYTNEFNDLVLTGSVEYTDTDQRIDRFLDKTFVYCTFSLKEVEDKSDGNIVKTVVKDELGITMYVNNIGILENAPGRIKYRLFLSSLTWKLCQGRVSYTNYGKGKEFLFDIARNLLTQAEFDVDNDSFSNDASIVKINYITDNNDTIITALRYLFNKMCFSSEYGIDESIKGIVYDEHHDVVRALDTQRSCAYQKPYNVVVNQMKTEVDPVSNSGVNLAYNVKQNKTSVMETMFTNKIYTYSLDTNNFSNEQLGYSQILNYYHGHNTNTKVQFAQDDDSVYWKSQMSWNNNINVYWDQMKNLMEYNGLILNMPGKIGIIPGWMIGVTIPIRDGVLNDLDKKNEKVVKRSYQSLCGTWIASRVTTFINPQKRVFRQNVSLMRNNKSDLDARRV